jgi:hypothetical protein
LRLDRNLPSRLVGPVLRLALARFAAICFSLANATNPQRFSIAFAEGSMHPNSRYGL